ncbi:hypothetical protein A2U01_0095388 [Trifolium medium]|uniref:Uncharacterized protein n=1 Tax=Trifolium medium TaxID=97028 RepID=A0A392UNA1_9FABA|nr:hypothetical protein [Trifolium medium]
MGDQPVTKIAVLTAAIKALSDQMAALTTKVDDIANNNTIDKALFLAGRNN